MSPIDQHLKELLLDEWQYNDTSFWWHDNLFNIRWHARGELCLRFNGLLMASAALSATASLEQVHQALKQLFSHLPRYDVRLVREKV